MVTGKTAPPLTLIFSAAAYGRDDKYAASTLRLAMVFAQTCWAWVAAMRATRLHMATTTLIVTWQDAIFTQAAHYPPRASRLAFTEGSETVQPAVSSYLAFCVGHCRKLTYPLMLLPARRRLF